MGKFVLAAVIAIVYIVFLFLEMRFILKENKPLKTLFRDGLLVYLSVLLGETGVDNVLERGVVLTEVVGVGGGVGGTRILILATSVV